MPVRAVIPDGDGVGGPFEADLVVVVLGDELRDVSQEFFG